MKIIHKDENSASGVLVDLLRVSPAALRCFLVLCEIDPSKAGPRLEVDHRHKTDQGREIDILIHDGDFGIIVECKVEDVQKHYQFGVYQQYWRRTRNSEPRIVWLLKKRQDILGNDVPGVVTVMWNQLKDRLTEVADGAPPREAGMIREFCACLDEAEICLKPGEAEVKRRIRRGYDHAHADRILTSIRDAIPGIVRKRPVEFTKLPPALHVGRPEWGRLAPDEWVDRVWFYFDPIMKTPGVPMPYCFTAYIYLANDGSGSGKIPAAQLARIPKWATFLAGKGYEMTRNVGSNWHHDGLLRPPYTVNPPVKFVHARDTSPGPTFRLNEDSAAIESGITHLKRVLEVAEKMMAVR